MPQNLNEPNAQQNPLSKYTEFSNCLFVQINPQSWFLRDVQKTVARYDLLVRDDISDALSVAHIRFNWMWSTNVIKREGDRLVGQREGRPATTLNAEVRDVFFISFISGQLRTRKIFRRDSSGKVTGFIDRREGEDLIWNREAPAN